ncbi:MAG TPA: hypothetical protein VGK20_09305 [Candidatus Binatia bacterium]|jgi:hypothetical protein
MKSRQSLVTKLLLASALVALPALHADLARAAHVSIGIGIPAPPVLTFSAAPEFVALPGTGVYVVPDYDQDVYFVDGWYWRPWEGHWYRSHYYDRDWISYGGGTPYFYRNIPHDWRTEYSSHTWHGRPWNYERVAHDQVEHNWSAWKREGRWNENRTVSRPEGEQRNIEHNRSVETQRGGTQVRGENRGSATQYHAQSRGEHVQGARGATEMNRTQGMRSETMHQQHGQPAAHEQHAQPMHATGHAGGGGHPTGGAAHGAQGHGGEKQNAH